VNRLQTKVDYVLRWFWWFTTLHDRVLLFIRIQVPLETKGSDKALLCVNEVSYS